MHKFSIWLRTSSNPADINRFRSHTGKLSIALIHSKQEIKKNDNIHKKRSVKSIG